MSSIDILVSLYNQSVNALNDINTMQRYVINEAAKADLPGKEFGPYDAYRHLLISAELTRVFGREIADAALARHELEGLIRDGQGTNASSMDYSNNVNVGMEIGEKAQSWNDVVKAAREAIDQSMNGSGASNSNGPVVWRNSNEWVESKDAKLPSEQNWPTNPDVSSKPVWPDGPYSRMSESGKMAPEPFPDGNKQSLSGYKHPISDLVNTLFHNGFSDFVLAVHSIGNLDEWFRWIQAMNDNFNPFSKFGESARVGRNSVAYYAA
jgi:hypothetical protein